MASGGGSGNKAPTAEEESSGIVGTLASWAESAVRYAADSVNRCGSWFGSTVSAGMQGNETNAIWICQRLPTPPAVVFDPTLACAEASSN